MAFKKSLIFGKGINDLPYSVHVQEYLGYIDGKRSYKTVFVCPFYKTWHSMVRRCYSDLTHKNQSTYIGCETEDHWLYASNFRGWMDSQDWENKALDKDILGCGKLYSRDTCCFVPGKVNGFLSFQRTKNGGLPPGVQWRDKYNKYVAACGGKHLGHFNNAEQAFQKWFDYKMELLYPLIEEHDLEQKIVTGLESKMKTAYSDGMKLAEKHYIRSLPSALIDGNVLSGAQNILKAI